MPEQIRELLDEKQVAKALNVSEKTIQYWRWKGVGPVYIKFGRAVRYDPLKIQEFLDQRSRISTFAAA